MNYITLNITGERSKKVSIDMFVDTDLAGDKYTRHRHTRFLIFANKAPIQRYINIHATVESSTFES